MLPRTVLFSATVSLIMKSEDKSFTFATEVAKLIFRLDLIVYYHGF